MNEKFFDLASAKQDKMINAALMMFAKNGYKHASTDDIVKAAGISKGLLFHYFESKEGLYTFLLDYSVRYLINEFSRVIGDEKDYFAYHEKFESAKLNVLRNYPYMHQFVEHAITESNVSIREKSDETINLYSDTMNKFRNSVTLPSLRSGIDMAHLETMIQYTVSGLTEKHMSTSDPDPDKLYAQIADYLGVIKALVIA